MKTKKKQCSWSQGGIMLLVTIFSLFIWSFTQAVQPEVAATGWNGYGQSQPISPNIIIIDNPPGPILAPILSVIKYGTGTGTVTGPGINCGLDCSEEYGYSTVVELNASADEGSVFRGWSGGGCSGSGVCAATVGQATRVTAVFTLSPELSPAEGTVGTQITITGSDFGTKKGKVLIGDKATKIIAWDTSSITIEVNKALPPNNPHYVLLIQKEPTGIVPIVLEQIFTMMEPVIVSVSPPGEDATVVISGNYFGTKKGKVYLEYEKNGLPMMKNCKVTSWGMDSITFVVPKTSKSFPPGTYPLKVKNKVGIAEAPSEFTVE